MKFIFITFLILGSLYLFFSKRIPKKGQAGMPQGGCSGNAFGATRGNGRAYKECSTEA